jgi:hypothetical protein
MYSLAVVSLLTIFVDRVSASVWSIVTFIIHQSRSTPNKCDGLHFQIQAALRNKSTGGSALWRLIKLGWAWKGNTNRVARRITPLAIITIFHGLFFLAASVYLSGISSVNSEVLIRSDVCGWVDESVLANISKLEDATDIRAGDALMISGLQAYRKSVSYAMLCYANNGSQAQSCQVQTKDRITSIITDNASCPFAADVCATKAVALDSGLIDSALHLGINTPQEDRIQIRKVTTCAPILVEEKFSTPFQAQAKATLTDPTPQGVPGDTYKYYNIGKMKQQGIPIADYTMSMSNYTIIFGSPAYDL